MSIPAFQPPSGDFASAPTFQMWLGRITDFFQRYLDNSRTWINQTLLGTLNTFQFNYGADIASAGTINPTALIHRVTGAVTISTINPPATSNFAGLLVLISKDGFSTDALGNIQAAYTVNAGHTLMLAYHPVLNLWCGVTS